MTRIRTDKSHRQLLRGSRKPKLSAFARMLGFVAAEHHERTGESEPEK